MKQGKIGLKILFLVVMQVVLIGLMMNVYATTETEVKVYTSGTEEGVSKSLTQAIADAQDGDKIELQEEITIEAYISLTKDVNITLDLNGKTITRNGGGSTVFDIKKGKLTITGEGTLTNKTATGPTIAVEDGASLLVEGGTIKQADGATSETISVHPGATAELINGEVIGTAEEKNSAIVVGNKGADKDAKLTLSDNVKVTGNYGAVTLLGKGKLTLEDDAELRANGIGIATHGSVSDEAEITINGGSVTGNGVGIYLPKGTATVNDGTITGQAGIVVRGGELEVIDGTITATGTGDVEVGDAGTKSPASAIVVDKNESYNAGESKATLKGGTFIAEDDKDAIAYTHKSSDLVKEEVDGALVVEGGNFSSSVDKAYLDESLSAELEKSSGNAPFSYYTSVAEANAAAEDGDEVIILDGKATIIEFGFKASGEDANEAINSSLTELNAPDSAKVSDSITNTMYAVLKGTGVETDYLVKFSNEGNVVYELKENEAIKVKSGCVVYFSFNDQAEIENLKSGMYTVEFYKKDDASTPISTATLNISLVKFANATDDENDYKLPADTYYMAGEEVELPTSLERAKFIFKGWKDGEGKTYTEKYTVSNEGKDIILTAQWNKDVTGGNGGGGSATTKYTITVSVGQNGSVSPTGKVKVEKGESKRFEITPNNGYEIDDVLVDGKSVGAVTSYTFEKVEKNHTLSATFKATDGTQTPVVDPTTGYADVAANAWFKDAVKFVTDNKLMNGTGNNKFEPDLAITRGMLATVIYRLAGASATTTATYTDVPATSYYSNAIAWAAENGIVTGVGENRFEPDRAITREEMATMISRYITNMKLNVETTDTSSQEYVDASVISEFAVEAVKTMKETGLMEGKNGNNFDPKGMATRAEVATILMRFVEKTTK